MAAPHQTYFASEASSLAPAKGVGAGFGRTSEFSLAGKFGSVRISSVNKIVEDGVFGEVGGFLQDEVEKGVLGGRRGFPGAEKKNNAAPDGDRQITK